MSPTTARVPPEIRFQASADSTRLRRAGLVDCRRGGRWVDYRLAELRAQGGCC